MGCGGLILGNWWSNTGCFRNLRFGDLEWRIFPNIGDFFCFCAGATTYFPPPQFAPHAFLHDGDWIWSFKRQLINRLKCEKWDWNVLQVCKTFKLHQCKMENALCKMGSALLHSSFGMSSDYSNCSRPKLPFSVGNVWISLRCFLHNSGTLEKSFEGRSEGILGPHDNRGPMH